MREEHLELKRKTVRKKQKKGKNSIKPTKSRYEKLSESFLFSIKV